MPTISKGVDSEEPFSRFKITGTDSFEKNLAIKTALNTMLSEWRYFLEPGKTKMVTEYITEFVCEEFRDEFSSIE